MKNNKEIDMNRFHTTALVIVLMFICQVTIAGPPAQNNKTDSNADPVKLIPVQKGKVPFAATPSNGNTAASQQQNRDAIKKYQPSNKSKPVKKTARKPLGNTYAVLIGYNSAEKDHVQFPEFAKNDVESLARQLINDGVRPENIIQMTTDKKEFYLTPAKANILDILRLVSKRLGKHDTLWVLVSGTGIAVQDEPCFLTLGATVETPERWVTLGQIQKTLAPSKAKSIRILWLASRKNTLHLSQEAVASICSAQQAPDRKKIETANRLVLFACSENGFANEDTSNHSDMFLYFFLNAMKSRDKNQELDILVTFNVAKEKTKNATKDFATKTQTPALLYF